MKVSIIVPIYNVERYLESCIESILSQTYENFELILVDDGSPDQCGIICDKYATQDSRIKVIHKENQGLGMARNTETGIEVSVRPMLIPETHALATVNDSFNAVFLTGDAVGDAMFYGRGAGELPTASAIAGDVFDVARNIVFECTGRIGCTCYKQLPLKEADEMESRFFLRMHVSDCAGTLASIASVFGNNNVSIAQVIQKNKEGELAELVVVTSKVKEGNFNDSMMIIEGMSVVQKVSKVIRVYGD